MSIESPHDLDAMKRIGRVVALILAELRTHVAPGTTTGALDRLCARLLARHDARSGPQLDYGFPGALCVSVNDEAVHGIPGSRTIQPGDLVKLDLVAEQGDLPVSHFLSPVSCFSSSETSP
jgi:methionyl aminopeptidase